MTKRDFQLIAASLYDSRPKTYDPDECWDTWNHVVSMMCINLAIIHPRFDEDKFRKACGGNER